MTEVALGRYRLVGRIGAGGTADVWLAVDQQTGARVAVKRLHPNLARDPTTVERFQRETAAARAVEHPNVVGVLDAGPGDVVLEYVEGETLAARLRGGPLQSAEVRQLAADLASALEAVHAAGLVHRDVTPANIIVDPVGHAHLADFGIARPVDPEAAITPTGDLIATLRYAPPEVLDGRAASPASDIWSLGATLYEVSTGEMPYPSVSLQQLVVTRQAPPPHSRGGLFDDLVAQMLDPDPAVRPAASAVASQLASSPEAVTQVLPLPLVPVAGVVGVADEERVHANPLPETGRAPARPTFLGDRRAAAGRTVAAAATGVVLASGLVLAAASPAEPLASTAHPTAHPAQSASPSGHGPAPSPRQADHGAKPDAPKAHHSPHGHHGRGNGGGQGDGGGGQGDQG
jgi:hypothetical protein